LNSARRLNARKDDFQMKFEVYKDKNGEWRWRLIAANGRNVASPGEGYKNKADCLSAIETIKKNAPTALVVEI
jgi:uncharacterized protein